MGLFSRFKAKEERLYKDPESGETSWVPVEHESRRERKYENISNPDTGESIRVKRDSKPLTFKDQFKPRVQPWDTPRGKKAVKSVKSGISRLDKAVVKYNRTSNPVGSRKPRYKTHNNYNPFGSMFDTGLNYKPYRPSKKSSSSKSKYYISGGKAYPIASPKKKKSKSKHSSSDYGFDMTDNWGFF